MGVGTGIFRSDIAELRFIFQGDLESGHGHCGVGNCKELFEEMDLPG